MSALIANCQLFAIDTTVLITYVRMFIIAAKVSHHWIKYWLHLLYIHNIRRYFQISGGLDDFEAALGKNDTKRILGSGSCSALIKLLSDNKELYVSHDTWNEYQEMIRIFKYYDLPYVTSSSNCEFINVQYMQLC